MLKKILIIDDEESILDAVSLILEDAGFKTDMISKGEETYQRVDEIKPDLILLDVLLSGNDGRSICKRLKKDEETKHIPIIIISAHPSIERTIKDCGADYFLAKPFEAAELLSAVQKNIK